MKRIIPFALLVALAACQLPFSEPHGQVSVSFVVPEAPPSFEGVGRILDGRIGRMVVSVSIPGGPTLTGETLISQAPGSTQTLTVNLVPAGTGRTVTVTAFDLSGTTEILSGTTANVTVVAGQQVPVSLSLVPSNNQFVDLGDPAWRLESLGAGSTVNLNAGGLRYLKFTAPGAGTYDFDLLDTAGVSLKFYDATGKTLSNQVATNRSFAAGEVQWIQVSAAQGATLNAASLLRVFGAPLAVTDRAGLKSAKIDLVTKLGDFGADLTAAQALEGTGPGQYLPAILTGASTKRDAAQTALTGLVASVAAQTADLDLAQTWLNTGANPVLTGFSSTTGALSPPTFSGTTTSYTLTLEPLGPDPAFTFDFEAGVLSSLSYNYDNGDPTDIDLVAEAFLDQVVTGTLTVAPTTLQADAKTATVTITKPQITVLGVTPTTTYSVQIWRTSSTSALLESLLVKVTETSTDNLINSFSSATINYSLSPVANSISSLYVEAAVPSLLTNATVTLASKVGTGNFTDFTGNTWNLEVGENTLRVTVVNGVNEAVYLVTVIRQTSGSVTVEWPTELYAALTGTLWTDSNLNNSLDPGEDDASLDLTTDQYVSDRLSLSFGPDLFSNAALSDGVTGQIVSATVYAGSLTLTPTIGAGAVNLTLTSSEIAGLSSGGTWDLTIVFKVDADGDTGTTGDQQWFSQSFEMRVRVPQ